MGNWLLKHQRSLLFLLALLAFAGIFAAFKLPVALFPNIQFPRIVVSVDAGDRPNEQMLIQVTKPLEQVLESVPNMTGVRSVTGRGAADVSVNFSWGADMVTALLQVQAAINQVLPKLPSDTSFTVTRMDPASRQMMGFSLTSTENNPVRLRDFAYTQLRPLLATVPGVARVEILGGDQPEYQVIINPVKLASYGLTLNDISNMLANNNILSSVGVMGEQYKLFLILADTQLMNLQDIQNLSIPVGHNSFIRLDDIATVRLGTAPNLTAVTANGQNAVLVNIYQQEQANTVAIVNEVNKRLASFKGNIPSDITLSNYYDQSQIILGSADSVRDAIIIGAILAGVVLFIFLRNLRMMLIVALVLPVVLAITTLLLFAFNMSFNIMTLGGMAAAVGLIIDDGVVMLEHITRRLAEAHKMAHSTVIHASMEMLRPLAGSSFATIIIFLPLAFLSGVTGGFFKALALTMAASLSISFFVVVLAVPILGELFLKVKDAEKLEKTGNMLAKAHAAYAKIMHVLFRRHKVLWLAIAVFIAIGALAYTQVGSGFIPSVDEGGFVLDYQTPPGTSLYETNRLLMQAEKIIMQVPDVDNYSRRTGLQMGGGLTEPNTGDIYIHLKPFPRRGVDEVMTDISNQITAQVPGLTVLDTMQLMEDMIGDLTDVPQPVEVKIYGPDQTELEVLANQITDALNKVSGMTQVNNGIVISGPSINIHINPTKAAFYGLDVANVSTQINNAFAGNVATEVPSTYYNIGIRVIGPISLKNNLVTLENLPIISSKGKVIPLRSLAIFEIDPGQPELDREDLQQMIAVTGAIQGRDMGSTMKDVITAVAKIPLPPGYHVSYGGLYQQQQQSFHDLLIVFISALMLIMLLLLFLYENFAIVASIICTTLLTLPGIFFGLWLTGTELDISSIMGMTMILGIVTEIAIFYFAELADSKNHEPEQLIHAGIMRMRPILMTSIIAILALLPLALGASMQTPLAIAIIAGLIFAVPLVLFVMPVLYGVFARHSFQSNKTPNQQKELLS